MTLLALVGGAGALAWYGALSPPGDTAAYRVVVVGPEGELLNATAQVENATALSALQVAAGDAGLALVLEEYPGMGTYVRAIGGHRATGASGWVYHVLGDATWVAGDRSAASYPLQAGETVRWSWTQA